jgi:hypothetical protein
MMKSKTITSVTSGKIRRVGKYDKEPPAMKKVLTMQEEVNYHLARTNRTLDDEFHLVLNQKSTLPARLRQFILSWYEFQFNQQQSQQSQQLNQNEEVIIQSKDPDDVHTSLPDELHPGDDSPSI